MPISLSTDPSRPVSVFDEWRSIAVMKTKEIVVADTAPMMPKTGISAKKPTARMSTVSAMILR